MSDTEAWPTQDAVAAALGAFAEFRKRVREQIQEFERDDPRKTQAIGFVNDLDDLEYRMRRLLSQPGQVAVPLTRDEPARLEPAAVSNGPRHRVGEQTNPRLRLMRGNRRSL